MEPPFRRAVNCVTRWATRARRRGRDDGGFSLLETIVALSIVTAVLVATGGVLLGMLGGALMARQNQQSAELLSEEIERVRASGYSAAAMDESDLAGDPEITGPDAEGKYWFDSDRGGPLAAEQIALTRGAAVNPHLRTESRNSTAYTIATYVTEPSDSEGGRYRRVTVRVEWTRGAVTHERQAGTLVTLTRRGLPLPNFTFGEPMKTTVNQGATAVLPTTLVNRGARDAWNLSVTTDPSRAWSFTWYRDENKNGVRDPEDIVPLSDSDGDGTPDTGELDTDEDFWMFAVTTVPLTEVAGSVKVTLKAVSVGQPSSPTGTGTIADTVDVVAQSCNGCTFRSHYLRNAQNNTIDTQARSDMPMQLTAPTETSLPNYDTNRDSAAGRWLSPGGSGESETSTTLMANWQYSVPNASSFGDLVKVKLRAALKDFATTGSADLTVYVRAELSRNNFTTVGWTSATLVPAADGGFRDLALDVAVTPFELDRNRRFEVKVVSTAGEVWLAYGITGQAAVVDMPVISG